MPFVVEIRVPGIINDPPISGCMSTGSRWMIKNTEIKRTDVDFGKMLVLRLIFKKCWQNVHKKVY